MHEERFKLFIRSNREFSFFLQSSLLTHSTNFIIQQVKNRPDVISAIDFQTQNDFFPNPSSEKSLFKG